MKLKPVEQPMRCERHGAPAGWECTVCHQPLCPDCAAIKFIPPITMLACGRCGEMAEPLLRRKSQSASLAQRLPGAFRFPLAGEGLPAWLGISLWLYACSWLGLLGSFIGWGVAMASFFGLTRSTARGGDSLELSDFQEPFQGIVIPLVRFALATLPAWGGILAAAYLGLPWLSWTSLAVAALWSPTAFIGAAANTNLVHMLNPVRVLGATSRIGKDFGVYLAALLGVGVMMVVSALLAMLISKWVLVPVIGGVMMQMVLCYAPFVGARVAGLVLMLHGPVFGWGEELDLYEPLLGATQPRGELPVKESSLPRHLPQSIELPPEPEPEPARAFDRFAALELNPEAEKPPDVAPLDVALLPSFSQQAAVSIRAAMKGGLADVALDGFRSTGLSAAEALSFDELLWLGQTAANRIDYESAELAFAKAAERTAPPEALGRCRVMLARLLAERMNRKDAAATWMKLKKWPKR